MAVRRAGRIVPLGALPNFIRIWLFKKKDDILKHRTLLKRTLADMFRFNSCLVGRKCRLCVSFKSVLIKIKLARSNNIIDLIVRYRRLDSSF